MNQLLDCQHLLWPHKKRESIQTLTFNIIYKALLDINNAFSCSTGWIWAIIHGHISVGASCANKPDFLENDHSNTSFNKQNCAFPPFLDGQHGMKLFNFNQPFNFLSGNLKKTSGADCPGTEKAPNLPQQSTLCSPTWLKHLFSKSIYSFIQTSLRLCRSLFISLASFFSFLSLRFDVAIVYSWIVEHIYQQPAEANKQPIERARRRQRWRKEGGGWSGVKQRETESKFPGWLAAYQ